MEWNSTELRMLGRDFGIGIQRAMELESGKSAAQRNLFGISSFKLVSFIRNQGAHNGIWNQSGVALELELAGPAISIVPTPVVRGTSSE